MAEADLTILDTLAGTEQTKFRGKIRVKVTKVFPVRRVKTRWGREYDSTTVVIADHTKAVLTEVENHSLMQKVKVGAGLSISNFTMDPSGVCFLKQDTLVGKISVPEVPARVTTESKQLNPNQVSTITDVLKNKAGVKLYNISGKITGEEVVSPTKSGGQKKDFTIEDTTGSVRCTLWDGMVKSPIKCGSHVNIKGARLSNFGGPKLDLNVHVSEIEVQNIQMASQDVVFDSVDECNVNDTRLITSENDIYILNTAALLAFVKIDVPKEFRQEIVENLICGHLPLHAKVNIDGDNATIVQ